MVKLRAIDDVDEHKKWIDQYILDAFANKTIKGKNVSLKIENAKIEERNYSLADQKKAWLYNRNLSRPIHGDVTLIDNATGNVLDQKKKILLASAPFHTDRNTIISNGVSFTVPANQLRLRPGVYVRKKSNGDVEAHYNLQSGTGSGFRINLDPEKGVFKLNLNTLNAPLYPFLKMLGADDVELKEKWGSELFENNKNEDTSIIKFYDKLVPFGDKNISDDAKLDAIRNVFLKAKMDAEVNQETLGKPYEYINKDVLLDTSKKIIGVSKGEVAEDERDSAKFKKVFSAEDFYKEKIVKDAGDLGKKLMYKLDRDRTLEKFPKGFFTKQLWGVIKSDPSVSPEGTLAQPSEEINPLDIYDQQAKITLMGEGGIGDERAVTMEARGVHPSEYGFIDYIKTPESSNVGIEKRIAVNVYKGDDNNLYKEFINTKTGQREFLNPMQISQKIIAYPGEWESDKEELNAIDKGKIRNVPRNEIDYRLGTGFEQFSTFDNLVPIIQTIQGNRAVLANKAIMLTVPLVNGEEPYLQTQNPLTGNSYERELADKIVNKVSKVDGVIKKVTDDEILVKSGNRVISHSLFNNFPFNRKTYIHNTPVVKVGDTVKKGSLLATSNFSTKDGALSLGVNLNAIFVPDKGWNFEDGITISESAAKNKLASEHMYSYEYQASDDDGQIVNKQKFLTMFPQTLKKEILDKYDDDGVIKVGQVVKSEEPLILAMEKRPPSSRDIQLGNLHKILRNQFRNATVDWSHHNDGVVTDVIKNGKEFKVLVKTISPANVGDKLTGRFGNKGVISRIVPDEQMPLIKSTNERVEIVMNPIGIPSRINPGQVHELILSKVTAKTGKKYILPSFDPKIKKMTKFVINEAKNANVPLEETVIYEGRAVPNVMVGKSYIWKLSKMSEGELKKRALGGYDVDEQPIKGKSETGQALRIGLMEINSLVSHGAKNILRDVTAVAGQKNPEFWRALKLGYPLPSPQTPFVYNKFLAMLKGSGINVKKDGTYLQVVPLTDKDTLAMSRGRIDSPETLYSKNLMPVKGGLFDPGLTGGIIGQKWNHTTLAEKFPNPVMIEPLKKILRINDKELKTKIMTGSLEKDLLDISLDDELKKSEESIKELKGQKLDNELKRLKYLKGLKKTNTLPHELLIKHVPILPAIYRPISVTGSANNVSPGSANLLYKDLITANQVLELNKKEFASSDIGQERMTTFNALKAVSGLGQPINLKNASKGVSGFISEIVGDQPKSGYFQKRVLSKTQDLVSRSVVAPDPTLSLDEISIPKESAWSIYKPFVIRRMVQGGVSALDAAKETEDKTPRALKYLEVEMRERPVLLNRNPSLHKLNIMAMKPKLNNDNVIKVAPQVVTGFNMDFDGDQANLFGIISPASVNEAKEKLLPSKNLLHIKNRAVHYLPSQGTVLGLYSLTQPNISDKIIKTYNSIDDLKRDFNAGLVKETDLVEVKHE